MGTITNRVLNKLHNSNNTSLFRPEDDAGYEELVQRLLGCLELLGSKNPAMRPESPMHSLLRKREFGTGLSPVTFQRGMQRALILSNRNRGSKSIKNEIRADKTSRSQSVSSHPLIAQQHKNRTYQFCETYHARGLLGVFGQIMVSHKQHSIFNLELAKEIFVLSVLLDHENIITSLFLQFPLENTVVSSSGSPDWLVVLTKLGRLLILNLKNGELLAQFLLPVHEVRFSSMYPNEANCSFSVYGQVLPTLRPLELLRLRNSGREYVIAMFNIHPLTFNGMFKMPREVFGDVVNVNVIGNMVIVFRKNPHEVVIYELKDLRNKFTHHAYQPGEFADGTQLLPFSIFITEEPQICSRIEGNWLTLEYSGFPYHFLGTPSNSRCPFKLMDAAQRKSSAEIEMPLGFCDRPVKNNSLIIDDTLMFFLADESGRILKFEGNKLVSYDFRDNNGRMKITEQWRTSIWADECFLNSSTQVGSIVSRSGRRITPAQDFTQDYRLTIKGVEYSPDLQMLFVSGLCDLHSPVFDDPKKPYDFISRRNAFLDENEMCVLAYCIDAITGKIIKASIMRSSCLENVQFQLDALDAGLTFLQRGRQTSVVEVQRLQEVGVKEWGRLLEDDVLKGVKSNTLSRKERRRRGNQEANSRSISRHRRNAQRHINNQTEASVNGQSQVDHSQSRHNSGLLPTSPRHPRRQRRRFEAPYNEDDDDDWSYPNGTGFSN